VNQLVPIASAKLPALVAVAGDRAGTRFLEFFAANIRNPHMRRAYGRAAEVFLTWCAAATRELAAPSVKQRLAATDIAPFLLDRCANRAPQSGKRSEQGAASASPSRDVRLGGEERDVAGWSLKIP
jgi:hypothetical protein